MKKEIIICICVILFIVGIYAFTQNNSKSAIDKITDELTMYKDDLINQIKNKEENSNKEIEQEQSGNGKKKEENVNRIKEITDEFDKKYEVLAFYIEHDELEKVKTELVNIGANIETGEYEQANADIERAIFLLDHIKQKMSLQVKNIF